MFDNNHIAIHEVRYANSQENSLIVLFSDQREEQPQIQEMEVEVRKGDAYYEALRKLKYTPKKIKQTTAEWKRIQSRELSMLVDSRVQALLVHKAKEIDLLKEQLEDLIKKEYEKINQQHQVLKEKEQKVNIKYKDVDQRHREADIKYKDVDQRKEALEQKEVILLSKEEKLINDQIKTLQDIDTKQREIDSKYKEVNSKQKEADAKFKDIDQRYKKVEESRDKFRNIQEKSKMELEQVYTTKMESIVKDTFERNNDPDQLFKFKLALFDIKEVKESNKQFKSQLRKAQSIIECYALVNEVYQSNET